MGEVEVQFQSFFTLAYLEVSGQLHAPTSLILEKAPPLPVD